MARNRCDLRRSAEPSGNRFFGYTREHGLARNGLDKYGRPFWVLDDTGMLTAEYMGVWGVTPMAPHSSLIRRRQVRLRDKIAANNLALHVQSSSRCIHLDAAVDIRPTWLKGLRDIAAVSR